MTPTTSDTTNRRHTSHWGAFTAAVQNGKLVGVTPFEKDSDPATYLKSIPGAVHSEARIAGPVVRKGWLENGPGGNRESRGAEPFVAVSWDNALDLVADELRRVKRDFRNESIMAGSYGWSSAGKFHHARTQLHRFMNCFGGFTGQIGTYSTAAATAIMPHVVGTATAALAGTSSKSISDHAQLMVCFGGLPLGNMQSAVGGVGDHDTLRWLREARANGCEFVSISPIREDMAEFIQAGWLQPRPNTDTAVMLALAHVLATESLHDEGFLSSHCVGYDNFERYVLGESDGQPKTPEWAAAISGTEADAIRSLARRMSSTRTMLTCTYSLQRGDHGEQPFWMVVVLAAMLGQIGLPGGGFAMGYGSIGVNRDAARDLSVPILPAGRNPVESSIPVARISDMLLHPGEPYQFNGMDCRYPDIKLVYWSGGNPFHHHQDVNRLIRAWQGPDTIIVNEPWWTATARHADIVLPATTSLERNDLSASAGDRFVMAMQKSVEPVGDARNDFDIFLGLARRLGIAEAFDEGRDEEAWVRHLYDLTHRFAAQRGVELPGFDAFWEQGFVEIPPPAKPFVMFDDFRSDPEEHPLRTPSGKVEIFSEKIAGFGYDDCPGHPVWQEPVEWLGAESAKRYPLHLISNQPSARLHSQMDQGSVSRDTKIRGREPITMHTDDATARGLADGDIARVFNDRGEVLAGVAISDGILPGVVALATGAWYDPLEPGKAGTLDIHGNPNVLTLDKGTSKLAQGPAAQSALVEIDRYDGVLPEITVFSQPTVIER
ncbi:MAG: molybdopterin guanine dinucleotide-containing S/N-oxide reductase [SAR202 cluster bacterium]|nr:molybdopterin guanine dinucleotide-containing S/N-oxide reductase [SAR202 cluster bacterium]